MKLIANPDQNALAASMDDGEMGVWVGRLASKRRHCAFTLIELILIMAILVMAVSLTLPALSKFFDNRSVESDARRFAALTRYAQSRAVSEGIPMMLWIDPASGTYGLRQESGYTDQDPKTVDFTAAKEVQITVPAGSPMARAGSKLYAIHFSPDGSIVTDTSVSRVCFNLPNQQSICLAPAANHLSYEIQ